MCKKKYEEREKKNQPWKCQYGVCDALSVQGLPLQMCLRGSLFLKLDCNLDKGTRGPWEGAGNPDKLLEELCAGSLSELHVLQPWKHAPHAHAHTCACALRCSHIAACRQTHIIVLPSCAEVHQCVIVYCVFFSPPLPASSLLSVFFTPPPRKHKAEQSLISLLLWQEMSQIICGHRNQKNNTSKSLWTIWTLQVNIKQEAISQLLSCSRVFR